MAPHPGAPLLSLDQATVGDPSKPALEDVSLRVEAGERWGILGATSSGKSVLLQAVAGKLPLSAGRMRYGFLEGDDADEARFGVLPRGALALVSPRQQHDVAQHLSQFHQARWHGMAHRAVRVADALSYESVFARNPYEVLDDGESRRAFDERAPLVLERVGLPPLMDREVTQLSNGELRRLLLARALLLGPRLLLLDEPFLGLDEHHRAHFRAIFDRLAHDGVTYLLATSRPEELPDSVSHVLVLQRGRVRHAGPRSDVPLPSDEFGEERSFAGLGASPPSVPPASVPPPVGPADGALLQLVDVTVTYGGTRVLDRVSWTVTPGQHWAVLGPNGAGKSTLLSLVLADNPQAYANDVRVLGHRRGPGHGIWEVKRAIGWVSPELQAHFPPDSRCIDVVCSGYFASVGLFDEPTAVQRSRAFAQLERLGAGLLGPRSFRSVSDGFQRLVLVARALVAEPPLLILDEPAQGLDLVHRRLVLDALDEGVASSNTTLVVVAHHADELPRSITHVLRLERGRVVEQGMRAR